jgi:uncharacterized protein YbjT (DUF2867 family)
MRVRVSGGSGFVTHHVETEVRQVHELASAAPFDAAIHLASAGVRGALDDAWTAGARVFVLLSTVGANATAPEAARAEAGRAEEQVRASGLPWVELRPDIIWGPEDVLTNELSRLVRHLPFVPVTRGGVAMAPLHVADLAGALVEVLGRSDLWGSVWSLRGPEEMRYGEVVARVAAATAGAPRRRLAVPASWVRQLVAIEERVAGRPRATRKLVDWRVSSQVAPVMPPLPIDRPMRTMTVEALREYLGETQPPEVAQA